MNPKTKAKAMKNITINITIPSNLSTEILSYGLNNSIDYWADQVVPFDGFDYNDPNWKVEIVDDEGCSHVLTMEKYEKGFALMMATNPTGIALFLTGEWGWMEADYLIQCSLFGKVIYG